MITTWEFYGYRERLAIHDCEGVWVNFYEEALIQLAQGAGNVRLGTQPKHWTLGGRVDLVLVPRKEMTWRMMSEGFWGALHVCTAAKEFQFVVIAAGVEGDIGTGQVTMRRGMVASA